MGGTVKVYFDLSRNHPTYIPMLEKTIPQIAAASARHSVVDRPSSADLYIVTMPGRDFEGARRSMSDLRNGGVYCWNWWEDATGFLNGAYSAIPKRLYDKSRHSSYCFPVALNKLIEPFDCADAQVLWSFTGNTSYTHRAYMAKLLKDEPSGQIWSLPAPWHRIAETDLDEKRFYADSIRRTKFVLCPDGSGPGSQRMFEAMEANRVPVIISDQYVFPKNIDWESCSVHVRPSQIRGIPKLLTQLEPAWRHMAANARRIWEENFSPGVKLDRLVELLSVLPESRISFHSTYCLLASTTRVRIKRAVRKHVPVLNKIRYGILGLDERELRRHRYTREPWKGARPVSAHAPPSKEPSAAPDRSHRKGRAGLHMT